MAYVVFGGMAGIILFLIARIYLMKKSAREITAAFSEIMQEDTNALISISSRDGDMLRLATCLNRELKEMRRKQLLYDHGNTELKNAVTNISHDLRTPLTAICGYLDMMQRTELSQQQARYLAIMQERTELMKQLTEELFRYSVIASGDENPETEAVLVNQVLEDSIMGYYAALSEKGISPEIHLTEKPIMAELNRDYLARIFSNLLNNAVKYSAGDLNITLSDSGEITFSNMAKGLSAVEVEQLFDRFYTVEAAHHSTGLGLSIARTLVERMGGTITAEYTNERLTMKITFP